MERGRLARKYLVPGGLAQLAIDTTHLTLMISDPFIATDPLTVEPAGAFSRTLVDWVEGSDPLTHDNQLVFVGVPAGTKVIALAGFTGPFNGELTFTSPVPPTYFNGGWGAIIPAGGLTIAYPGFTP